MHTIIAKLRLHFLLLAGTALFIFTCSCDRKAGEAAVSDKPLAVFQIELLDIAFETATAIPVNPHLKDRSRAQAAVVETCLELSQSKRALGFIERIDNWRRGSCYADLAFYCVQHGYAIDVERYLNLAGQISETAEDWRRDRIRIKIAKTHTVLGQTKQANQFEADVVDSEAGKVAGVKAMISDADSFDEQMKTLEALIAIGNFDILKNVLQAYAQLFNRFYNDTKQRSLAEEKIKTSWDKLPVFIRMELLMELAGFALDHEDQNKAIELVNEAQLLMDDHQWPLEHRIPMMAKLVGLRFRAGDIENARTDADTALALFNAQKSRIVNIYRAEALRPIAQAYQSMGDTEAALSVYKQVVEEGVKNPNSRPCAEDLSATCCSIALYAVEPDTELWRRIRQISEELGQPW